MFNPGGYLGSLFNGQFSLGAGAPSAGWQPTVNSPTDRRTPYTGAFNPSYDVAGDPNNKSGQGPELGPTPGFGGSQLAGHRAGMATGYITPPTVPGAGQQSLGGVNPYQINGNTNRNMNVSTSFPPASPPAGPQAAPHAREPGSFMSAAQAASTQPMLGQWGGGGWNVGSGAPASMQPMWLGSMNGGQNWGQAPGYNATAPRPGQSGSSVNGVNWKQAPNQDADSPTWKQY